MMKPDASRTFDEEKLQEYFHQLDQRISRIEAHLGLKPVDSSAPEVNGIHNLPQQPTLEPEGEHLELRFGEFGLAWIGSVILLLGMVFLIAYTYHRGQKVLATALGFSATVVLYLIARYWRDSIPHISRLMLTSSLLLLYYTTMRLYFFSEAPIVSNIYAGFCILLLVVAVELFFALWKNSQTLSCLTIVLGLFTSLLSDSTQLIFLLVVVSSALAVHLALRREWMVLLNISVACAYITHLLWFLNNPLAGHQLRAVAEHQYNLICLFLYAGIFCIPVINSGQDSSSGNPWLVTTFLNAAGFSLISAVESFALFPQSFANIYLAAAICCILFSMMHWRKKHQQLAPAVYACLGYMALSIAIYGYAGIPAAFLWLSLESLLVVSMALWFRSRTLVVANSFIYVCVLLAYLISSSSSDWVNFSFALVALASARVMNWQKERLTLRTSMLRNIYLGLAFVLVLYSLYYAVPGQYVTLTWTAAAVGYFTLSVLLHNIKYRWMAICTMLMTVLYLFLVDLARLDAVYRVAAFLFLGLMALVISLFYTKYKRLLGRTGN